MSIAPSCFEDIVRISMRLTAETFMPSMVGSPFGAMLNRPIFLFSVDDQLES